uniref:tRNA:m(4)X modification enzyme TRM13 n=1 Tax=Panagrolaimus superbus TaxID=310955 RepID=A0A914XQB4_9BILA
MKNKLLENDPSKAVFELGVGRGQLAFYMASQAPETKYILVDYSGIKHKADNKVKNKNAVDIKRIRCPIEHVDASKIPSLTSSTSVSAVCKHFCGSATDYGINCITNAMFNNVPINGFCLAPCCHHRITISQYVGHDYLKAIKIDSPQLISSLRLIASWATCGPPVSETAFVEAIDDGENFKFWSYEKKLILGRKAKALIEFGRVLYLRKVCGFDCRLLEYIDVNVSPENLMIVGVVKK